MGIILSCFKGIGKTYLINTHGKNVEIADLSMYDGDYSDFLDMVVESANENDIVFVSCNKKEREILNENNVDYDLFYPSKDRRREFIENEVRKHTKPSEIQSLDKDFESIILDIEEDESENCFKHKLANFGEFIGNNPILLSYISDLKNVKKNE